MLSRIVAKTSAIKAAAPTLLRTAVRSASALNIDTKIYEHQTIHVKAEHIFDYQREMERYLDLFPVPFKIIGSWIVDQGGSGEFAMMSHWESQTQRKETLMKYMTDPGFEFYLSRIGPMCHTFHQNTLRACPGFEMSIPSKPSEYEIVMYRFKNEGQSTEVLFKDMVDIASDLRSHMAKLDPDTGGVVGAWFTEYGTPGDMAVLYHYPDMQWRENVLWPSMVSGDFKKKVEKWEKKLDKVTNRSLIVVPNQHVLLK